jgi:hypothetical protein
MVMTLPILAPISAPQHRTVRAALTADVPAHLSTVAAQRGFDQFAPGYFGDKCDHIGAYPGVLAPPCITEANDLYALVPLKDGIRAPVTRDIAAFCAEKFGRGLRTARDKEEKQGDHEPHVRTIIPNG